MKTVKITKTILISLAAIFAFLNFSVAEAINHDFTGLPLDSNGWTDYQSMIASGEYNDSRVVFVSNLGNDLTGQIHGISSIAFTPDGRFNSTGTIYPYATIAAAYAQCRNGYADIMLFKTGDEWDVGFGGAKIKSGVSQTARHIISSYGTGERPALKDIMVNTYNSKFSIVSNIKLHSDYWLTAGRGIDIGGAAEHQLFEDVLLEQKGSSKIDGSSNMGGVAFRRCVFTRNRGYDGMIYATDMNGLMFEETVFHEPLPDEARYDPEIPRFYRFFYFSAAGSTAEGTLKNVILRGNIFYRGERESFDFRSGGVIDNNLILQTDTIGIGGGGGSDGKIYPVWMMNNVMAEGLPNRTNGAADVSLRTIDIGQLTGNIWTNGDTGNISSKSMIRLLGNEDTENYIAKNIKISKNIVYGYQTRAFRVGSEMKEIENIEISENEWQFIRPDSPVPLFYHSDWTKGTGNRYAPFIYKDNKYWHSADESDWFPYMSSLIEWTSLSGETGAQKMQIAYPDPSRSVGTYTSTIGGGTSTDEFMNTVIAMHRGNWNGNYMAPKVNDYIRAGFNRDAVTYSYEGFVYPSWPTCEDSKSYCYTEEDCTSQGGYFRLSGGVAKSMQCFSTPQGGFTCAENPALCTIDDCEINGWVWSGGVCQGNAIIRADVNGSSQITTTDALLTLRNSLGLSMNGTAWRASATTGDVNCDGVSNSTDALLILRHSLGLSMSETPWCGDID